MKATRGVIGLVLMAAFLMGCGQVAVEPEGELRELQVVDSVMQSRPDSALAMLQVFASSPAADSLDEFNGHYCQLLISELLYKNDYAQTNRKDLLKAVAYFDTVDNAFLTARAHYINGVGFYEKDSVVRACEEYMQSIETMEEHFKEKDLVGDKAKFMALAYTHLCSLFSDQYLHEQAIYFGKLSLSYYSRYEAEPWHVAWVIKKTGSHFDMMEQWDSARFYYDGALEVLPDSNSLTYRDITSIKTFLSYKTEKNASYSVDRLKELSKSSDSEKERLARYSVIGEIYFHEKLYDSAWIYLTKVFDESDLVEARKQAAEWLVTICKSQGKSPELYAEFLVPYANKEENESMVKSQLTVLYNEFCQKTLDRQHRQWAKERWRLSMTIIAILVIALFVFTVFYHRKRLKVEALERQIEKNLSKKKKMDLWEQFLGETVCQEIMLSVKDRHIKRSAVPSEYPELILNDFQLQQLELKVNRYFNGFVQQLEQHNIYSNPSLVNLCYLYLLGLDEKQAAVLLNRDYSSIIRYEKKLQAAFKTQKDMGPYIRNLALKV